MCVQGEAQGGNLLFYLCIPRASSFHGKFNWMDPGNERINEWGERRENAFYNVIRMEKEDGRILLIFDSLEASCSTIWEMACPHFGKRNIIREVPTAFSLRVPLPPPESDTQFSKRLNQAVPTCLSENWSNLNAVYKVIELSSNQARMEMLSLLAEEVASKEATCPLTLPSQSFLGILLSQHLQAPGCQYLCMCLFPWLVGSPLQADLHLIHLSPTYACDLQTHRVPWILPQQGWRGDKLKEYVY